MDDDARDVQLRRIADRLEIEELVARYCVAVDDHDFASLRELMAADMRWAGSRTVAGRDAVLGDLQASMQRISASVHTPEFVILTDCTDRTARGTVGAHVELVLDGQLIVGYLRYLDTYACEDGRWRFSSRSQRFQYVAPADQLAEVLTSDRPVRWPGREPSPSGLTPFA